MRSARSKGVLLAIGVALLPGLLMLRARGSDHADTPAIAQRPGGDLTDVFIFPSPTNANNVVLIMDAHGLIPPGQSAGVSFDPNVLYQFKIDNTGDAVEDLVIQAKFSGTGAGQQVQIAGPVKPTRTGTVSQFETADSVVGTINQPFTLSNGVKVFAGAREDPFFFDLEQFYTILPDRAKPVFPSTFTNTSGSAVTTSPADPNAPQATTWRPAGQARDYLAGLNCLSVVVEMPKSMLTTPGGNGKIRVWCTTSI